MLAFFMEEIMKRILGIVATLVLCLPLISCKSGVSGLSEVEESNVLTFNRIDLLPVNCRPTNSRNDASRYVSVDPNNEELQSGYGAAMMGLGGRIFSFIVLPETCRDYLLDVNEKLVGSKDTTDWVITDREVISSNDSIKNDSGPNSKIDFDRFPFPDSAPNDVVTRFNWCNADTEFVREYMKGVNSSNYSEKVNLCDAYVLEMQKKKKFDDSIIKFFRKYAGRPIAVDTFVEEYFSPKPNKIDYHFGGDLRNLDKNIRIKRELNKSYVYMSGSKRYGSPYNDPYAYGLVFIESKADHSGGFSTTTTSVLYRYAPVEK